MYSDGKKLDFKTSKDGSFWKGLNFLGEHFVLKVWQVNPSKMPLFHKGVVPILNNSGLSEQHKLSLQEAALLFLIQGVKSHKAWM